MVERRTTLVVGPLRLIRERRGLAIDRATIARLRPERQPRHYLAGVIGLAAAATLCTAGLITSVTGATPRYSVRVVIPPLASTDLPRLTTSRPSARPSRRRRVIKPVDAVPTLAVEADDPQISDSVGTDVSATSRADAISKALISGELQQWRQGDTVKGFVVAGPIEKTGAGRCRALSILTRTTGADDRVEQQRKCRN